MKYILIALILLLTKLNLFVQYTISKLQEIENLLPSESVR